MYVCMCRCPPLFPPQVAVSPNTHIDDNDDNNDDNDDRPGTTPRLQLMIPNEQLSAQSSHSNPNYPTNDPTIKKTHTQLVWFRSSSGGGFAEIKGVDGPYYQPSADDVGTRICVKCTLAGSAHNLGGSDALSPAGGKGRRGRVAHRGGGGGESPTPQSPQRHQAQVTFAEVRRAVVAFGCAVCAREERGSGSFLLTSDGRRQTLWGYYVRIWY